MSKLQIKNNNDAMNGNINKYTKDEVRNVSSQNKIDICEYGRVKVSWHILVYWLFSKLFFLCIHIE